MVTGDEWWRLLPPGTSGDALRVLAARGVRAFADGFVALLLPIYLVEIGFNALAVGAIVASTLVGTALLTLWVGLIANRHSRRMLLLAASVLMAATGVAFATVTAFWPLLVIAFVGTINPTSGDASIFQPLEQTVLTQTIAPRRRTALFARYSVIGSLAGAAGVLAAAIPDIATAWYGFDRVTAIRAMFVAYGLFGVSSLICSDLCRARWRRRRRRRKHPWDDRDGWSTGSRLCSVWIRSAPAFLCSRCWRFGCIRPFRSR